MNVEVDVAGANRAVAPSSCSLQARIYFEDKLVTEQVTDARYDHDHWAKLTVQLPIEAPRLWSHEVPNLSTHPHASR